MLLEKIWKKIKSNVSDFLYKLKFIHNLFISRNKAFANFELALFNYRIGVDIKINDGGALKASFYLNDRKFTIYLKENKIVKGIFLVVNYIKAFICKNKETISKFKRVLLTKKQWKKYKRKFFKILKKLKNKFKIGKKPSYTSVTGMYCFTI